MPRTFVQNAHLFDEFDPPTPPPGMTLLGSYRGFWFASTASGRIWSSDGAIWHGFCGPAAWPETPAYKGLTWIGQQREAA